MKKKQLVSQYKSARQFLSPKDFAEFRKYKQSIGRKEQKDKLANLKKQYEYERRKRIYEQSRSGRVGSAMTSGLRTLGQKQGVTRFLYRKSISPAKTAGSPFRTGKVGRPVGTLKREYAPYGGVYEYRKAMAHKRALERMEYLRSRAITPDQQRYLKIYMERKQAMQQSPEAQIIPDTYGTVSLNGIFKETEDASNLVA